jgi:hypothetical protein
MTPTGPTMSGALPAAISVRRTSAAVEFSTASSWIVMPSLLVAL